MSTGKNISVLYFSMAVFLWLGGVNSSDSSMQATGSRSMSEFLTVGANGTFTPNATLGALVFNGSTSGIASGSFIQTPDGLQLVKTALSSFVGFFTGPFSFLIDAGMPTPIVVAFGGGLFVLGLISLVEFWRGKDF